jgi:hypothetical protein
MKSFVVPVVVALSIMGLSACSQQAPPPPQQAAAPPPPPQYMPPPPTAPVMAEPPRRYEHQCKAGRHWVPAHYTANHHRVRGHCSWGHGYRPSTVGKRGV